MGIHVTEYIQLAILALFAVGMLGVYNHRQIVGGANNQQSLGGLLFFATSCFTYVLGYFYYTSFNLYNAMFLAAETMKYFNPNNAEYGGIAAQYMWVELPINAAIAMSISYLTYAFIRKRKNFRNLFLSLHALVLAYLIAAQVSWVFIPQFNQFNLTALIEITAVALSAFIWMPYMLKSKRVARTFIK